METIGRPIDLRGYLSARRAWSETSFWSSHAITRSSIGEPACGSRRNLPGLEPALRDDEETAFSLIYGEFALRESAGESPQPDEFYCRFPQFADRLKRQLDSTEP